MVWYQFYKICLIYFCIAIVYYHFKTVLTLFYIIKVYIRSLSYRYDLWIIHGMISPADKIWLNVAEMKYN